MKNAVLTAALVMFSATANAAEERVFTTFGVLANNISTDTLGVRATASKKYFEIGNIAITRFDPAFYSTNIYGQGNFLSFGLNGYYSLYQNDGVRVGLGGGVYADLDTGGFKVGDAGILGSIKALSQSQYPWLYYADYTVRLTGTPSGVTNSALSIGGGYSF